MFLRAVSFISSVSLYFKFIFIFDGYFFSSKNINNLKNE
jgi:hypothetical protein